ncbi:MAG: DUF4136 domain-containing protein [Ignavibacteriales bacterium]
MRSSKFGFSIYSAIITALFFLISCSSITVNQDYDPAFDFSKLKSFGFIPITSEAGIDQLSADKLGNAIKTELIAKGYKLETPADFGIALMFSQQTKTNVQSYGYGYGYGGWGGAGMYGTGGVDVTQYQQGTLIIDIIDMSQQKLIWRGTGSGIMSDSPSVETRTENVNNAVNQILAQFPPDLSQK